MLCLLTLIDQTMHDAVTQATLAAFSDAWNRHDVDALMSFMHDDCVFQMAAGVEAFGTQRVGRGAVRTAFAAALPLGVLPTAS